MYVGNSTTPGQLGTGDWGPVFWRFLHQASYYYPDVAEDKKQKQMMSILLNLNGAVWCARPAESRCRLHGPH